MRHSSRPVEPAAYSRHARVYNANLRGSLLARELRVRPRERRRLRFVYQLPQRPRAVGLTLFRLVLELEDASAAPRTRTSCASVRAATELASDGVRVSFG